MSVILAGRPLRCYQPLNVIDIAYCRNHALFDLGSTGDNQRNCELLAAFGGCNERSSNDIIAAYASWGKPGWSHQFNALIAGETLGFGIEHGIIERVAWAHAWRLVQPDLLFEQVGPEKHRRSLRVRDHATPAQALEAHKLLEKEMKKRERSRLRAIEKYSPSIRKLLAMICRRAPDHKLDGWLTRFAAGEYGTVAACHGFIEVSIQNLSDSDVWLLDLLLRNIVKTLPSLPKPEPVFPDDLDEFGRIFL